MCVTVLCRMWRTRKKPGKPITMLSLPEAGQLVFLVDRSTTRASEVQASSAGHLPCMHPRSAQQHHSYAQSQSRGVLRDVGRDLQQRMRTGSPFNASGTEKWNAQQHLIVAFEVSTIGVGVQLQRAKRCLVPALGYALPCTQVSWNSFVGIDWSRPLVHDGRLVLEVHAVIKRVFRSVSSVLAARLTTSCMCWSDVDTLGAVPDVIQQLCPSCAQTSDAHDFYGTTPPLHAAKAAAHAPLSAAQHSNEADADGEGANKIAAISPAQPGKHTAASFSQPPPEALAGRIWSPSAGDSQRQPQRQSGAEADFPPVDANGQQQCRRQSSAPVAVPTTPMAMPGSPAGEVVAL
jgi:hypothetical protein